MLRFVAAALSVACLTACTAITGDGRPAPIEAMSIVTPEACYVRNTSGELWQVRCEQTVRTPMACYVGGYLWGLHEVRCPSGILRTAARRRTPIQEE